MFVLGDDLYPEHPDYEGVEAVKTSKDTVEHLRLTTFKQNRSERSSNGKVSEYRIKNLTLDCGQIHPVMDIYQTVSKL